MKKRVLKKWVKNLLCGESIIIFSFIATIDDFNELGFIIMLMLLLKLIFNISILSKYTNVLDEEV